MQSIALGHLTYGLWVAGLGLTFLGWRGWAFLASPLLLDCFCGEGDCLGICNPELLDSWFGCWDGWLGLIVVVVLLVCSCGPGCLLSDVDVTVGLVLSSTLVWRSLPRIGLASAIGGGASSVAKWGMKFVGGDINLSSLLPSAFTGFKPSVIGRGLPAVLGLGLNFSLFVLEWSFSSLTSSPSFFFSALDPDFWMVFSFCSFGLSLLWLLFFFPFPPLPSLEATTLFLAPLQPPLPPQPSPLPLLDFPSSTKFSSRALKAVTVFSCCRPNTSRWSGSWILSKVPDGVFSWCPPNTPLPSHQSPLFSCPSPDAISTPKY